MPPPRGWRLCRAGAAGAVVCLVVYGASAIRILHAPPAPQPRPRPQQQQQQQQQPPPSAAPSPAADSAALPEPPAAPARPPPPEGAGEAAAGGGCESRGPSGGCGSDCFDLGQNRCCRRAAASGREVGHLDDVPWDLDPAGAPHPRREPAHDPSPLLPAPGARPWQRPAGRAEELGPEGAPAPRCTGIWGEELREPVWLQPLWRRVAPVRDALLPRLRPAPGWAASGSALVVWTPARFMPWQKPGKNVRGETVDAATRGSNATYYLEEYRAVWHASFAVKGATYHAQLVDRKALVVCLWERLHIYRYNCEEVPVHFCLCRHCKESYVDGAQGVQGQGRAPAPRHEEQPQVYNGVRGRQQGECVAAEAAPWLLPRAAKEKFPWEGLHNDMPALLAAQADRNKVVTVFIFNRFWIDHLHNVVWSMVGRAGATNYVVAVLDCESLELCAKNRLPCLNAINFAEPEHDMRVGASGYKQGFKRKVTEELSWIKPRLALRVLDLGFSFMMVDMDMSWNHNPMADVVRHPAEFAHQCDSKERFSINTGFYLLRRTPTVFRLFENILVFPPWRLSDQNALKLTTRYDHTHGCSNGCLDRWRYNMKCNYKAGGERIENGVRTFKWKPQQRDRSKFDWFIFHATCLDGAASKVAWLRTSNAWFLDDLENMTSAPGGYCMRLPDGERLRGLRRRTLHSTNYQTGVDPKYLQERH